MSQPLVIPVPQAVPVASASEGEKVREVVDSQTLFQGQREIWIEHEGERYRLRITRRGKLILQK
jgi:hemin uptake protein HemP